MTSLSLNTKTSALKLKAGLAKSSWDSQYLSSRWWWLLHWRFRLNIKLQSTFISFLLHDSSSQRGPITKVNQSKCSIAGPIFSKYRTGHCPEWSRTRVFAVFAFFSRVINLLLTNLPRDRTGRISAVGLFCTDLAALGPYCQDLGTIFSQYGPRAWLIRYIYSMDPGEYHVVWDG